MKKIDLHIHTVKTNSDADFEFNMESLAEYVKTKSIDVIAITNHNLFNKSQFQKICDALPDTEVFPGIEINIGRYSSGHLLLIASRGNISDFESKCKEVQDKITDPQKFITLGELKQIFGDLSEYLLIPHISKKPHMDHALIDELNDYICCGEVASIKDFIYHAKSVSELTPVIFSDFRAKKVSNDNYPVRQTYIDIGDTSLNAIKAALLELDGNAAMDELNENGVLKLDVNGENVELGKDDLLIEMTQMEGYVSESDNTATVVIDTNLTEELIEEGFIREVISKIQTMRKEADFEVMDKIRVAVWNNDKVMKLVETNKDEIMSEVLAEEVVLEKADGYEKEWNINGEKVMMSVKRK